MDRRRILIIFGIAWMSALVLTWFLWSRTREPMKEKTASVAAAVRDLPAGTKLQARDLKLVSVGEKDVPRTALVDLKVAEGRVLLFPISANEPLTNVKLSSLSGAEGVPATIEPGMRAISVPITDASGVAGLLQPRAHVDVLFTRAGTMAEALTTILLEDVVVLSIGRTTEVTPTQAGSGQQTSSPSTNRAVNLLVTPEDARKLELAKNQGRLSLALRNPLDKGRVKNNDAVTVESIDPYLFAHPRRPSSAGGVSGLQALQQLNGASGKPSRTAKKEEPPKPRLVVDVFRGDKHVQESFH